MSDTGKKKRSVSGKINPEEYFSGWHYNIDRAHYPAFGIFRGEFVNTSLTRQNKLAALAAGQTAWKTVKYHAWAIRTPPQYDFHEGDLFHARNGNSSAQLIQIKDQIETHLILRAPNYAARHAYLINEQQLVDLLKSGRISERFRITPDQSSSEILRYSIKDKNFGEQPAGGQLNLTL